MDLGAHAAPAVAQRDKRIWCQQKGDSWAKHEGCQDMYASDPVFDAAYSLRAWHLKPDS